MEIPRDKQPVPDTSIQNGKRIGMQIAPPTRESLLRYLLNEIDEAERERVDTLLIADPEYAAQFQEVEYDLIDALAAGEFTRQEQARAILALTPADRFSPLRHKPHSVAQLRPMPSTKVQDIDTACRTKGVESRFHAVRWPALAALMLVAVTLGVRLLAFHPAASGSNVRQTSSANQAGPATGATEQSTHPQAVPTQTKSSMKSAPVMAMLLLPGASRSANALLLRIPPEASMVEIDWPMPAEAETARYRLQLLNDAGKIACTSVPC